MSSPKKEKIEALKGNAWIGDAVLELYVRQHILQAHQRVDAEMKQRFTSNRFLNCLGNPTQVEANIGSIYQQNGLDAAFDHIRQHLHPLFLKQEANRK